MKCPICGEELELKEWPNSGAMTDSYYEGKCKSSHLFYVTIEIQSGLISLDQQLTKEEE